MKRLIIIVLLVISLIFGYVVVTKGIEMKNSDFKISSYEEIDSDSSKMTKAQATYKEYLEETYTGAESDLASAITTYTSTKEQYETLLAQYTVENADDETEESEETEEEIVAVTPITVYEIDFLWARIGNYAKSNGLTIKMDVSKSDLNVSEALGYGYYNLSFDVSGVYIDIADFLYDLEDDDELNFEIRDYSMTSGNATFTVYYIPINNNTLLDGSTSTTTTTTTESTTDTTNTTNSTESTNDTSSTSTTTNTSTTSTSSSSGYESIYNEYSQKLIAAGPSSSITEMAEILTEGVEKMAEYMWTASGTDGQYETYSEWADKLYDVYTENCR